MNITSIFTYITPIIYWVLIGVWTYILFFYLRKIRSFHQKDKLFRLMLIVLAIDSFRTVLESVYFGAWYTSLSLLIPIEVFNYLKQPQIVFIPKIVNLIAAFIILFILIRKWFGAEIEQKKQHANIVKKQIKSFKKNILIYLSIPIKLFSILVMRLKLFQL